MLSLKLAFSAFRDEPRQEEQTANSAANQQATKRFGGALERRGLLPAHLGCLDSGLKQVGSLPLG